MKNIKHTFEVMLWPDRFFLKRTFVKPFGATSETKYLEFNSLKRTSWHLSPWLADGYYVGHIPKDVFKHFVRK